MNKDGEGSFAPQKPDDGIDHIISKCVGHDVMRSDPKFINWMKQRIQEGKPINPDTSDEARSSLIETFKKVEKEPLPTNS